MKATKPIPAPPSVAVRFRSKIEQAVAEGAPLSQLTLRLTRGSAEQLKRDRSVALAEISFANGAMTFLGVKVVTADVSANALDRTAQE
jgi:hypothetical protein